MEWIWIILSYGFLLVVYSDKSDRTFLILCLIFGGLLLTGIKLTNPLLFVLASLAITGIVGFIIYYKHYEGDIGQALTRTLGVGVCANAFTLGGYFLFK